MKFQSEVEDPSKERMPMDPCGSYALTLHGGGGNKGRSVRLHPHSARSGLVRALRARSDAFTPGLRCRQGEACYKCLQANIVAVPLPPAHELSVRNKHSSGGEMKPTGAGGVR